MRDMKDLLLATYTLTQNPPAFTPARVRGSPLQSSLLDLVTSSPLLPLFLTRPPPPPSPPAFTCSDANSCPMSRATPSSWTSRSKRTTPTWATGSR